MCLKNKIAAALCGLALLFAFSSFGANIVQAQSSAMSTVSATSTVSLEQMQQAINGLKQQILQLVQLIYSKINLGQQNNGQTVSICAKTMPKAPTDSEKTQCANAGGIITSTTTCEAGVANASSTGCSVKYKCDCSNACGNGKCNAGETASNCPKDCTVACTPKTCASLGYECDAASDGCGNALQCGTCSSGNICVAGKCQTQGTCGNGLCESGETAASCAGDCAKFGNTQACATDSECQSGSCNQNSKMCCNVGQCGWGDNNFTKECVNDGERRANSEKKLVCRNGVWKTDLNGWGCGNSLPCDKGSCKNIGGVSYCRECNPASTAVKGCQKDTDCATGTVCRSSNCCASDKCGWGDETNFSRECVASGEIRSNSWAELVCRGGEWKVVLNGWGCDSATGCDQGTCQQVGNTYYCANSLPLPVDASYAGATAISCAQTAKTSNTPSSTAGFNFDWVHSFLK